jgi:murein DD-endopeptidase MepM/ murein hydrolase activator NlpD
MPIRVFALVLVALSFSIPAFAADARAAPPPTRDGPAVFHWPLDPPVTVTRRFEPPPDPYKAGHRGADLLGAAGAQVRSAGPGVVAFAGMVAGRPVISVSHPGGLRTTYEPVDPSVRAGTVVAAGSPLGALRPGHPGCPAAACLHWGLRTGDTYLDPLSLLRHGRVRLLPL